MGRGERAYQSCGIGAVEAEEGDRGFDGRARGRGGGECPDLADDRSLGACNPRKAEQCLSRQHGYVWDRMRKSGVECRQSRASVFRNEVWDACSAV